MSRARKFLMVQGLSKNEGQQNPGRDEATGKKPEHSDQGGQLKMAHAHDGMARSAPAGIPRSETDQEPSADDEEQALPIGERRPAEQFGRVLSGKIGDAKFLETEDG